MHVSVGIYHYFENTYKIPTLPTYSGYLKGSCLCKLNWLGVQGKTQEAHRRQDHTGLILFPSIFQVATAG
jgi:hypothetical protein